MSKLLSNISYALPVEQISRKFARRKDTCSFKTVGGGPGYVIPPVRYMGASVRTCKINGFEGQITKNIFYVRTAPTPSVVTTEQIEIRSHFAAANKWANAAQKDLMAVTSNQQTYAQCCEDFSLRVAGVSARGYQTMTGWLKAIAFAMLSEGQIPPQDHKVQIDQ